MMPLRAAFVLEQTLGHVTHAGNLRRALEAQPAIAPTWLPIPFPPTGPLRFLPLLRSNWSARASWLARRALARAQAAGPLEALFFHTQVTALFSLDLIRRVPTVVSLDATPFNYDRVGAAYGHRPAGDGFVDRQKFRLNRAVFQAAAGLITWSDWARRSLIDDYAVPPDRIRVIAPGAARELFELGKRRLAGPPGETGEPVRVLFVGGDFERKGGPELLACLEGPLGARCRVDLVTAEAVAPRPNLAVHRGLAPNSPALLRLFAQADLFVLPSHGECLSIALMEAGAAGLPLVTTAVGALPEAVRPGRSGLVVPPGDPSALATALSSLVDDADLRRRMGRAAHELAREKFDADRNGRALLDVLLEAAARGRSPRRVA